MKARTNEKTSMNKHQHKSIYQSPALQMFRMGPLCDNGRLPLYNGSKDPTLPNPGFSDAKTWDDFTEVGEDTQLPVFRNPWED